MLLSRASFLYLEDVIRFGNQSIKTEENHLIVMKAWLKFAGDVECGSITFQDIREFKQYLEKGRSPATVRNYIIRVRCVLRFLKERGENVIDYHTITVPKRTDKVPTFITPTHVTILIECCTKSRSKAVISLLYASGVRVSELCQLSRLDLLEGSFTVVGKGGKARLCFTDARTRQLVRKYLSERRDNNPALFLNQQGDRRINPSNVQEILKVARKKAKFDMSITPHTLRHSFATNLLRNNTNLKYVQALLGHSSIETTSMYTHVVDKDLENIYKRHHSI